MESIKIYIVDDHPLIRLGISQVINQEDDMLTCGESAEIKGSSLFSVGKFGGHCPPSPLGFIAYMPIPKS